MSIFCSLQNPYEVKKFENELIVSGQVSVNIPVTM